MPETLNLRPAQEDDQPFLFVLYCDVRGPEIDAWGWPAAQRGAFLRMQFEAQRRSYRAAYPEAADRIVLSGGAPIGRLLLASESDGMQLIDIALLARFRNRGIGTALLREAIEECGRRHSALRLQVLRGNPALRLYLRIGFRETGSDAMYIQMERTP
jgi:ribosomal protein S18 acetylase RimI-like enzyme